MSVEKNLDKIQLELDFYKKLNPEAVIFFRKKSLAARLLKISPKDLLSAPDQSAFDSAGESDAEIFRRAIHREVAAVVQSKYKS